MWEPERYPNTNAVILEQCPHGRRFLTENLYRMAIRRITHVFSPAELSTSIRQLDYDFVFIDWGGDGRFRDDVFSLVQEWSRYRKFEQVLIMTTADGRESNLKMGMVIDCDALILKPYSPRAFCTRVSWAHSRKLAA
jgi:DNA-binding response OmpR family regulator